MTGLTSVLLMGAALYASFQGQDTFSTAYEALQLAAPKAEAQAPTDLSAKSARIRVPFVEARAWAPHFNFPSGPLPPAGRAGVGGGRLVHAVITPP